MKINLKVKYLDETLKSTVALPADLVAFETKYNLPITVLQTEVRMTYLYFLAYAAEKRTGSIKEVDFEKWVETIESVEADDSKK